MLDLLHANKTRFLPLCTYGRSGGSFLMSLLRACGVAVRGDLPYEDRSLQVAFIGGLARDLGLPRHANLAAASHGGMNYKADLFTGAEDEDECRRRLGAYCASLGNDAGIAEKTIGTKLLRAMRANDPANLVNPIYLARDPRDIFLSVKAFNARRQTTGFGDKGDDARLFGSICSHNLAILQMHRRDGGLLICYEDLMAQRPQSLVQLFQHLGRKRITATQIDTVLRLAQASEATVAAHRTSPTPGDGVGRWRTEEGDPYRAIFDERAANLNATGYPAG